MGHAPTFPWPRLRTAEGVPPDRIVADIQNPMAKKTNHNGTGQYRYITQRVRKCLVKIRADEPLVQRLDLGELFRKLFDEQLS